MTIGSQCGVKRKMIPDFCCENQNLLKQKMALCLLPNTTNVDIFLS